MAFGKSVKNTPETVDTIIKGLSALVIKLKEAETNHHLEVDTNLSRVKQYQEQANMHSLEADRAKAIADNLSKLLEPT